MKNFYIGLAVLFIVFLGINIYAIDFSIGWFADENRVHLVAAGASLIGIIVIFLMMTMRDLSFRK